MTTITLPRAVVEQALHVAENAGYPLALIKALRAALAQQAEPVQDQDVEDAIEAAYWQFDCRKKGLNEWASAPQSERDAFKAEARKLVRGYFPTRQAQDTKREMLAVADAFIRGKRAALAQQAEPYHETRAEVAEQQVVQLAEERDHYRNLWQKAQQAESPCACWPGRMCSRQAQCAADVREQQAGPVEPVWIQPDHLQKARVAPFLCRVEPTQRFVDFVPLYTAPLQRKPLTDEEIDAIGKALLGAGYGGNTDREFARAVERAHGIKE